jgi:hypothetical protein
MIRTLVITALLLVMGGVMAIDYSIKATVDSATASALVSVDVFN